MFWTRGALQRLGKETPAPLGPVIVRFADTYDRALVEGPNWPELLEGLARDLDQLPAR
jgi:hypothetical protein